MWALCHMASIHCRSRGNRRSTGVGLVVTLTPVDDLGPLSDGIASGSTRDGLASRCRRGQIARTGGQAPIQGGGRWQGGAQVGAVRMRAAPRVNALAVRPDAR
jgi:hypothetical protein